VANEHALHLFRDHRGEAEFEAFMEQMEASRERSLADAATSLDVLTGDYFFLRMGDLLSLTFCNGWTEPRGDGAYSARVEGARLTIEPDPFGGREIQVAIRARRVERRPYASPDDVATAFAEAPVELLAGVAGGA
jgi:hypothetical protein